MNRSGDEPSPLRTLLKSETSSTATSPLTVLEFQYAACTPLTECFFIQGIKERKRAPTFSME
jgi:hypothetical protein